MEVEPTIARYEIIAELGQGALATVYRARDPRLGREVAIKLLRREYLSDLGFRSRFEQEATLVAALAHPAIIHVYEFGEHEGQLYLVMAYMPNGSLADRLAQGPLASAEAGGILRRIAGALDFAHANGIVHRDLKPSNILFDEEGNATLGDFGIALQATAGGAGTAVISGTPAYMSPEQVRRDADAGGASDRYALAVTAYQMVTGRVPFSGDSPVAVLLQHLHQPPPALGEVAPELPAALDTVLQAALAKEPGERYATAMAFVEAFAAALADPEAAPLLPEPVEAPPVETVPVAAAGVVVPPPAAGEEAAGGTGWLVRVRERLAAQPLLAFGLVTLLAVVAAALAVAGTTGERAPEGAPADGGPVAIVRPETTAQADGSGEAVVAGAGGEAASGAEGEGAAAPGAAQEAVLRLVYDEARLTVINAGAAPLGLGDIRFYREAGESVPEAAFGAGEWGGVAGNVVNALPPGECFQLVNIGAPGNPGPTEPEGCSKLRGWIGTRRVERLPFLAGGPEAFAVQRGGEAVATCPIAAGTCEVRLP
jgi:tRNA A-37 threonylcarbamoyl transferase component Bud32